MSLCEHISKIAHLHGQKYKALMLVNIELMKWLTPTLDVNNIMRVQFQGV